MGPRMFIRGNEMIHRLIYAWLVASMGPRMFIRGNPFPPSTRSAPADRFNGAADVHPRKRTGYKGHGGPNGRFNGAADVHPRKLEVPTWRPGTRVASMGPRMFIRGNTKNEGVMRWLIRSFNGAADVHPRKRMIRSEIEAEYECFNGAADVHPRKLQRQAISGRASSGFNGAADVHPRKLDSPFSCGAWICPLQWGRGCSSAETTTPPASCDRGRASMGPRMFIRGNDESSASTTRIIRLQWGRGCSSAETRRYSFPIAHCTSASMGPRMFIRGNRR